MRELAKIILVCFCGILLVCGGLCLEEGSAEGSEDYGDQRRETKTGVLPGSPRRPAASPANTTRDSQLLSLLARRRQLLSGRQLLTRRLAAHISTIASIAHKPNKGNTTFAQLEVRDSNSSIIRRITFDNSSNEISPSLRLVTSDGSKEIKQDIKPHEIRHLFIPKIYQENRSRAGFINNRKKISKTATVPETTTDSVIYFPPEHLHGGVDKALDLEPEEEFQVDESNHGLYLLNYSDSDNITQAPIVNKTTTVTSEVKSNSDKIKNATNTPLESTTETKTKQNSTAKEEKIESNIIVNSTLPASSPTPNVQNDSTNQTLFMSDEIYNHFRPLESELPVEDMAPFLYFGQKLGGHVIGDNLTYSPSLSASTKSVNFVVPPPDKRRFNSRYSATEKYKNTSVEEEEVNEEMDVSVVKNVIEKNKVRNTVKGPVPTRNVGVASAYRKYSSTTQTTSKPLSIAQLNVTEPIVQNVTPGTIDKNNNQTKVNETLSHSGNNNSTQLVNQSSVNKINNTISPRNYTRNYSSPRRRPAKLTSASTESNIIPVVTLVNATTEKASTVYTAVVTSVSITSSMKGKNQTDGGMKEDNSTLTTSDEVKGELGIYNSTENIVTNTTNPITTSSTTTTTKAPLRPYKHRIRIRTTTTESSVNASPSSAPLTNETISRLSERLANLFKQNVTDDESHINGSTIRPKNILKRRRPTTTTSTSTTSTTTAMPAYQFIDKSEPPVEFSIPIDTSLFPTTTHPIDTTESTTKPLAATSKVASELSAIPSTTSTNGTHINTNITVNATKGKDDSLNQEVVIEVEKSYTASYVLAGLVLFSILGVLGYLYKNFMNKKTKELDTEYEGYFDDSDIKKESPITPVARPPQSPPTKPDQKWEFPRNKLRLQTLLGQGNFGQVWKAEADDLNGHDGLTRLVAVKTIKESATQKEKQELLHEILIMQKIGTHPNIVTLLACCTEQEPFLLIMEYVMCGKLLTFLRERRSRPDRFGGSGALTSRDLTVFAYCVARGMDYIASKGIVHRDLAARNVLVDHNKLCKIADFGMSRAAGGGARGARGALPVRWMAPEALLYNVHTHASDVWAYGILLWEIVTLGSTPYAAMSGREVVSAVSEGYRLERPAHCAPPLYRAMHACWHADPDQRPTFAAIKAQLATLLDNEPAEGNYVDLDSFYQESSVYSDPSAIIHDEEGLSAEYDRERRCFRELQRSAGAGTFEESRGKFGLGGTNTRMGGFGIRDVPFNERFSDGDFDGFERKDAKLATSSFHRERERDNTIVSRNSFNGFPRVSPRDFQTEGRNKRVPEFECDI